MPQALSAADFLSLRIQYKNTAEADELPAVIEHDFPGGRMVDHYFVRCAPTLLGDEAVQKEFGGQIDGLLFLQQPDGAPWQVLLHEPQMLKQISFDMPDAEFRKLLAGNQLILPGEPGFTLL